nr:small glutamine-rich tetratricopeptide repeat-containing protein [Tanacetum cinerariifolium]GEZ86300.1 small glutamine-rich tetratricopeptide repeat-containing protein [Tanacetum cinerariifolium]
VAFLGHIVSAEGITMDPAKVEAITKWPRPTSVIELMHKGEEFVWNEEREKSFEELRQRLVYAPVLTLPSGSGGFQIYSDASKKGLGCVLTQHGKDMKKSGCKEIDLTSLADTFKLQGNKAVESKLYTEAIKLYTVAIALRGDNAIYYCNRAAAYTHSGQDAKAIIDCQKAIAIDPKYIKAYFHLRYIFAQGKYTESLKKGYGIATHLDPTNQSSKSLAGEASTVAAAPKEVIHYCLGTRMICATSVYFMILMQDLMLPVVISYVNAAIDTTDIGYKRRS